MQRSLVPVLVALFAFASGSAPSASYAAPRYATPTTPPMVVMVPAQQPRRGNLGGGFIEFLFGERGPQPQLAAPPPNLYPASRPVYANAPAADPVPYQRSQNFRMDPRFLRQEVAYDGKQAPGTIVIDTPNHFLYLVEEDGKALRYGIGVGRAGLHLVGHAHNLREEGMAGLVPPKEMLQRQPDLPHPWLAARTIRSARARSISARRFTASTARTSPGPSGITSRLAASACATRTSSISIAA